MSKTICCLAFFVGFTNSLVGEQPLYVSTWGESGIGNGQFGGLNDAALDSNGNIYVPDRSNHRIQKFDRHGNYLDQWGTFGSGNGQFHDPKGIALDSAGNIYVADRRNDRVQKFDSAGVYLDQWGSFGPGDGQFDKPQRITVDSAGIAGLFPSTVGTAGLVGTGLNGIGMTALAKPLLFAASKLNPLGLVLGAFAGGGLAGQYLDDKTGWSDTLGARAKTHRQMCGSGYFCAAIGGVSTLPVASDVGNAIGWSGARLTLGFTDDNYTYAPWNSAWWPGN